MLNATGLAPRAAAVMVGAHVVVRGRAAHAARQAHSRLVGLYRGESGRPARIAARAGALVVEGLLWWENRLLPRAVDVFDAESWPFRFTFETDTTGVASRFRVEGPDLASRRFSGVYEKQAL